MEVMLLAYIPSANRWFDLDNYRTIIDVIILALHPTTKGLINQICSLYKLPCMEIQDHLLLMVHPKPCISD